MRARWISLVVVLAGACTPDIAPGTYLCGPEEQCPDDQACNGPDNLCVVSTSALPFECGAISEIEPNNAFANAQAVGNLECVSRVAEVVGCAKDADGEDWFQFSVPSSCGAVGVSARVSFPIAFEVISLELRDASETVRATGGACAQVSANEGDEQLCLDTAVTPGTQYAVRVARSGEGDCSGACAYNRYTLKMQLVDQ